MSDNSPRPAVPAFGESCRSPIAFSTAHSGLREKRTVVGVAMLPNDQLTPLFAATVQATEEAVVNALVAAETMTGIDGRTVFALPHDRLRQTLRKYNRLG